MGTGCLFQFTYCEYITYVKGVLGLGGGEGLYKRNKTSNI